MNVSPLDLRNQRFRTGFRGFDQVEVTSLLLAAADDYEQALRETDRLRQEVARLEALLAEHREHERNLQNTLLTAQRLSDEIKEHAREEAARILHDAENRATLVLEQAELRAEDLQRDIDGLRLKRRQAETSLESTILALRGTLDYVRENDRRTDEKILVHRPRQLIEGLAADEAPRAANR